ncbi:tryptamine hydroxycinnamoyltransferase 1-like [Lolium rigidum]|uniref:tryptamine hydroxycinnamoyltransferase 1-like n=1 Tax=Lolium rigidum TaxID=89674 RepID=UPI001F5D8732|nr:tryptamine hydroxycinnamoyltransferase 1-like [Lolium rigidum]
MDVQVQRTLVMPPPAAPSAEVPLTVFDLAAPTYHVTVLFAFSPPNPTNQALLDALAATLPRFPLLTAARLDRGGPGAARPCHVTGEGGAGALVVEAEVPSSALSDHLPLAPSPGLALLHPKVTRGAERHVLMLQINRFACGGIVLASSAHHQAADGHSMTTFLHAWADAVRGDDIGRALVPYGPAALVPRRPPRCEFEHRAAEFLPLSSSHAAAREDKPPAETDDHHVDHSEISNTLLHYTSEFVAELKRRAHGRYTTFETVSAHVWRKITIARGLGVADDGATRTSIRVAVNGRGRLAGTGTLPAEGFFGNVVLTATSGARAADLASGTLADAAALVRAGIRAVDGRYFQSFVDFGALHGGGDEELEPACADEAGVLSPDVEADSWLHLDLHRLDFGCGGRLVGFLPGKVPQDGVVVLMPSLRKGGGVDVFVALWEKHARELSAIAYTMD